MAEEKVIKVLIADDHQMFIEGIKALLSDIEQIHIIATANSGEQVLEQLADKKIDVLITDINMPKMNGIELARIVKKKYSSVKIIALSMYVEKELVTEMINNGAEGYILKNTGKQDLIDAIITVYQGKKFYSNDVALTMMDAKTKQEYVDKIDDEKKLNANLSKREIEILKLIAQQFTTPEIAEKLFISSYTVETHRKNLIRKLNVKNVAGLVRIAIENKLLD